MFDKQIEKKLQSALNNIDPAKLEQMKGMLAGGDLSRLVNQLDAQKAQQKMEELNLGEALKGVNLAGVVNELKKNPDILNELKKNL